MKRHVVVVFNRATEELDKLYVEAANASYASDTARKHYQEKGWTPSILLCLPSKFDADGEPTR